MQKYYRGNTKFKILFCDIRCLLLIGNMFLLLQVDDSLSPKLLLKSTFLSAKTLITSFELTTHMLDCYRTIEL